MLTSVIIGLVSGIFLAVALVLFRKTHSQLIYGLTLTGIGFLYVGFTWSDLPSLVISAIQAFVFLLLAYQGVRKHAGFLPLGFFLHGAWDLLYTPFDTPGLIPPHYDAFCLTFDFVIGFYLLLVVKWRNETGVRSAFDI